MYVGKHDLHTISGANKYCLKPIHGIYGINNCPQRESISPLVGIKMSNGKYTLTSPYTWSLPVVV